MYHIVADSGCDIFELEGSSFATVPLIISTETHHFIDDEKLDTAALLELLLAYKGRSYTACPSTEVWLKAFDLSDGSAPDELYIVTLTSGLSGTYNSAVVAMNLYLEKHPQTKATVIDSLSVGPEMRLLLEQIVVLKQQGASFEKVCEEMKAYSLRTRLFFAFKSLHNLAQNGRVNKIVAAAAGVLGISVYGTASPAGQIEQLGKARGDKKVLASLIQEMRRAGYRGGKVRISHTENEALAEKLKTTIQEYFPDVDILTYPVRGLCSYYCERGGICIALETEPEE